MDLKLNIYNEEGKYIRTAKGEMVAIRFGVIRKLMALLNVGNENETDILTTVANAWVEITKLLSTIFPDVKEEEWDNVDVSELIPLILSIAKGAVTKMTQLPADPNTKGA